MRIRVCSSFSFTISCVGLSILSSCQILKPYQEPPTPTPTHWKNHYLSDDKSSNEELPSHFKLVQEDNSAGKCYEEVRADLTNWWEIFEDPQLNVLEEEALNQSYTLWSALERVIQARQLALIQQASLMPFVSMNPSFNKIGQLVQNPLSQVGAAPMTNTMANPCTTTFNLANKAPQQTAATNPLSVSSYRFIQSQYLVPLNLNYELDLWSRLNNAYYAAMLRAQAASEAYKSVLLSLTADIAATYFQIRGLDLQLAIIEKNIKTRLEALQINEARFRAGLIAYVDVTRAQLELYLAKSDQKDVMRIRGLKENLLSSLTSTPASLFNLPTNPVQTVPPEIPTGIPSELLCRRPDVAEAERRLAAFYREIGVAKANFFPSLSINGGLGFSSPFGDTLFSWKARFWQLGLDIMQIIFDGGRTLANVNYYQALYRESFSNYQQTVVNAFQDVEDALVDLHFYAAQSIELKSAIEAAQQTLNLSQLRYTQGLVNYLDVVDAERSLLQAEQTSAIVLGNRYVATVQLIRSLGGGFGPCKTCQD